VSRSEDELYRLLFSLQSKEFLYEQPAFPEPDYIFKHALTQEVAYGTVLQDRRKALHERTAQAIESLYSTKLEDHYSELAHHYSCSGNTQKAIEYLHKAGQQAMQRSAYEEAVNRVKQALQLLEGWSDTKERHRQELLLQTTLGSAFLVLYGPAASEAGQAYLRARELCRQEHEPELLFPIYWGLWAYYVLRSEWEVGQEFGEQFLKMAQAIQDPARLAQGHYILAANLFWRGEFRMSQEHSEQSLGFYDSKQHHAHAFLAYGWDPGIAALCYKACTLWTLGYPHQASERLSEALSLAHGLSHPFSIAFTLSFTLYLYWFRREPLAVQERAKALETIATEVGFDHMWMPLWQIYGGWALAEQGYGSEGVEQIKHGFASYEATEMRWGLPHLRAILASAYEKAGETERSLRIVAEALEGVQQTGECFYEAELYRLKGELTLQKFQVSGFKFQVPPNTQHLTPSTQVEVEWEAEVYFQKAIAIAQRQQAKSLELRAVMSLVRLRQQQAMRPGSPTTQHETRAKLDAARNTLSEIYNWFTEGFDTKDLQEARALLEALS
jgi:predicted ATPase